MAGIEECLADLPDKVKSDGIILCDPCLYDGTLEEAEGLCRTCSDFLCQGCIKEHRKARMTRHHVVVTENLPDNPKMFKEMKKLVRCSIHSDLEIVAICDVHGERLCSNCLIESHIKCDIRKVLEWQKEVKQAEEIKEKLHEFDTAIKNTKSRLEKNRNEVKLHHENIHTKIKDEIQSMYDSIKALEIKAKVNDAEAENVDSEFKEVYQKCNEIHGEVRQYIDNLETASKGGEENDVIILSHVLAEKVGALRERVEMLNKNKCQNLKLSSDIDMSDLSNIKDKKRTDAAMSEMQVSVSSDYVEEETANCTVSGNDDSSEPSFDSQSFDSQPVITGEEMYNVCCGIDKNPCIIYKIIVLSDGYLILDHSNCNMKTFDSDFNLQDVVNFDDNPIEACIIGQDIAVVIFHSGRYVQKVRIEDNALQCVGRFATKLFCISIDWYNNNYSYGDFVAILMSDEQYLQDRSDPDVTHEIQIRNIRNGEIMRRIVDFMAFNDPDNCLTIGTARKIQFLGDSSFILMEEGRVMKFTLEQYEEAREESFYRCTCVDEEEIIDMRGIAYDGEYLYMCADTGQVIRMSPEDGRNREILLNVAQPRSIAIDKKKNEVIVGCRFDNNIHVYGLQYD